MWYIVYKICVDECIYQKVAIFAAKSFKQSSGTCKHNLTGMTFYTVLCFPQELIIAADIFTMHANDTLQIKWFYSKETCS